MELVYDEAVRRRNCPTFSYFANVNVEEIGMLKWWLEINSYVVEGPMIKASDGAGLVDIAYLGGGRLNIRNRNDSKPHIDGLIRILQSFPSPEKKLPELIFCQK